LEEVDPLHRQVGEAAIDEGGEVGGVVAGGGVGRETAPGLGGNEKRLAPLAAHPRATLDGWHRRYMAEVIEPRILPQARELVQRHLARGDLVALVTATNAFVTAPIARAFGIEHLVATGVEQDASGAFTGRSQGTPSFREGKIVRTTEWLASLGHEFGHFSRSWFYSDSRNDLPLLELVTDPIATNPDPVLHATAIERGWPVLRLFEGVE
jgi:HAD superfamily hydrolase (TIGR01490 family)